MNTFRKIALSCAGILVFAGLSHGQSCPTVNVSSPDEVIKGQPLTFTANVSGGDPNVTPTYNWVVSAGRISSGQGTSTITADTSGEIYGTITATVDVGGYDRTCPTSSSSTTSVTVKAVSRMIDTFGAIRPNDEKARLDNFAIEIQNDPTAQAHVIVYAGRKSLAGYYGKTVDRIKKYLVDTRGIDASRIIESDGGYREDAEIELWVQPVGGDNPPIRPTVKRGFNRHHVTINHNGQIHIGRAAHVDLGRPKAVTLYYEPVANKIALEPAEPRHPGSVNLIAKTFGAYYIPAKQFMQHNRIAIAGTEAFLKPEINYNNVLILDLNDTIRVSRGRRQSEGWKRDPRDRGTDELAS